MINHSLLVYSTQQSNKLLIVDNIIETYLWQFRLDHINKNMINKIILKVNNYESLSTCQSYLLSKMTKSFFARKGERANDVPSLIHIDALISKHVCHKFRLFKIFK